MLKRQFISILQNLQGFQKHDVLKEQYLTDAVTAGDILYMVGFETRELFERVIFDLGCGPGRLLVGAVILGADIGIGLDIDWQALIICAQNAREMGVRNQVNLVHCDVASLPVRDSQSTSLQERTVIMNPPFGKQTKYADRQFLDAAFRISKNVYSIHLGHPKTRVFLDGYASERGFFIDAIYAYPLVLEHTQEFHTHKRLKIYVDLYHFIKKREK